MVLQTIIGTIIFRQTNFVCNQKSCARFNRILFVCFFADILPVLMTSTVAYSFLLLAIIICSVELKSRQLLHSTYKLFVFSVMLQFFGILLQSMAYLKYAINGIGFPNVKITGNTIYYCIVKLEKKNGFFVLLGLMFAAASETCFLLVLLLLAKGYSVTRGRLPVAASIKITIFMCLYFVTYLSLFIYETKVSNCHFVYVGSRLFVNVYRFLIQVTFCIYTNHQPVTV